jgi:hypothetical protein
MTADEILTVILATILIVGLGIVAYIAYDMISYRRRRPRW